MRSAAATAVACAVAALAATAAAQTPGFLTFDQVKGSPYTVSYTNRSITVNGQPSLFVSGAVHPQRFSPAEWPGVFSLLRSGGFNMVQIYTFWNYHEPVEGQWFWNDRANLTAFVELAAANNLFVNLRVGPYVCAEWTYGGIPVWLGQKPGVAFRCTNSVWQPYMQAYFTKIVTMLAPYFASNGGPIILTQVENELHTLDSGYVQWCGDMANQVLSSAGIPVPVLMCNGDSATNTINTCNGNDCTSFIESNGQSGQILKTMPALWTENEGGFQVWGGSPSNPTSYFWGRTLSDIAFATARWFARGGSHMDYYMVVGGNHMGRWAGAGITAMYAVDAPICPDLLPHEPKWSHLGRLHALLAQYAPSIAYAPAQLNRQVVVPWFDNSTQRFENGTQQYAFTYSSSQSGALGPIMFVESVASVWVQVLVHGVTISMPPNSISLVDKTGTELWNSAKISNPTTQRSFAAVTTGPLTWKSWTEPLSASATASLPSQTFSFPPEQGTVSAGLTEYLYYETQVTVSASDVDPVTGQVPLVIAGMSSNAYLVFVDGVLAAEGDNHSHDGTYSVTFTFNLNLTPGAAHQLVILSETLGYDNGMGSGSIAKFKGIFGTVTLGGTNITAQSWRVRNDLAGNYYQVWSASGANKVPWSTGGNLSTPITWLQATFTIPAVPAGASVLLNITGLGRGHAFVNGNDIGRYWSILRNDGSNQMTQTLYHIPTDWLNVGASGSNTLTLGEILGAPNPGLASIVLSTLQPGSPSPPSGGWGGSVISCPL